LNIAMPTTDNTIAAASTAASAIRVLRRILVMRRTFPRRVAAGAYGRVGAVATGGRREAASGGPSGRGASALIGNECYLFLYARKHARPTCNPHDPFHRNRDTVEAIKAVKTIDPPGVTRVTRGISIIRAVDGSFADSIRADSAAGAAALRHLPRDRKEPPATW
jgi:hypothetical protein